MILNGDQILEELAKDCEVSGGTSGSASLDEAMKRLDETSKKVEDLQAAITEQFNKTVEDISEKLLNNPATRDEVPEEQPSDDSEIGE